MSKKSKTPTFLLELPLMDDAQQAKHLRAHFEAARSLYNALLGEAMKRVKRMRADKRWQQARSIPRTQKQERKLAAHRKSPLVEAVARWQVPPAKIAGEPQKNRDILQIRSLFLYLFRLAQYTPQLFNQRVSQAPRHSMRGPVKRPDLPSESQQGQLRN